LEEYKDKKIKFSDQEFPKNTQSLAGYYGADPKIQEKLNLISWNSFENFYPPPFIIYD
jgi:hypothetical protein